MKNQDRDVVKIGKKEYVQTSKLNWKAGDNETLIHMDFSKPKLKGYLSVKESGLNPKACKKDRHSARSQYDPKKRIFRCSACGRKVT